MSQGRGGRREGAGRPKGSKNAKTKALAKITLEAVEAGELPLDFLLRVMRNDALDLSVRMDAAKNCTGFVHPRLAASVVATANASDDGPLVVEIMRFVWPDGSLSASPPPGAPKLIEHE